jgi:hypothetical protein
VTAQASERRPADDRSGRFDWLTLGAAFVSFLITVNLVLQNVQTTAGATGVAPSAQAITGYWVVAGILIALQVGLLARGIMKRRGGLVLVALVALAFAVGATLIVSVPSIDWRTDPPAHTLDPDYRPCYSGSGDCVGG